MMPVRVPRAAAAALLVGGLAVCAAPALTAGSPAAAATVTQSGQPATLTVRTVPVTRNARVRLDTHWYQTNAHGSVTIRTLSGRHDISIRPPRSLPAGTAVRFSRWLDGLALTSRRIVLHPGKNVDQAGFVVSHPIAVQFNDPRGKPVPISDVTQLTIASSLGRRFTFSPTRPPGSLAVNLIARNLTGLAPLDIRYSIRSVIIDGSNVVYGGSQNFYVHRSQVWTVKVLLFPMQIKVRDALFGFPIGNSVRVSLPNGSQKIVSLGAGHAVTVTGLPRATYLLTPRGLGIGLSSPSTLSKPQVAKLLLMSWVDMLAVMAFLVLFLVGLPVIGGRIVWQPGRKRMPAWRAARPRQEPDAKSEGAAPEPPAPNLVTEAAPGDAGDSALAPAVNGGSPGPDRASAAPAGGTMEQEAGSSEAPAGESGPTESGPTESEAITAEAIPESEAITEVFAAITDVAGADAPAHSGRPGESTSTVATRLRTQAISMVPAPAQDATAEQDGGRRTPTSGPSAQRRPESGRIIRASWPTWNWRKS
jgi:hypothetical protein